MVTKINSEHKQYLIKSGRNMVVLDIDDIFYMEKQGNYIVYYTSGDSYRERGKITDKYNQIYNLGFVRTHIGFIVNIAKIREITSTDVILNNGKKVPLNKKYKNDVKMRYYDLSLHTFSYGISEKEEVI